MAVRTTETIGPWPSSQRAIASSVTLPPDQGQHAGQKFVHVHAAPLVVEHPFEEDAEGDHAANKEHDHQRAAPLHHLEQPDFFVDRRDVDGLRKEVEFMEFRYQMKDLVSATTVSPLRMVKRHETTGP